jgi:hypothetical protein
MALEVVAADDAMHRAVLEHVADGRMEATTAMIAVWPQRGPYAVAFKCRVFWLLSCDERCASRQQGES